MTDQELEALFAEKVMGWERSKCGRLCFHRYGRDNPTMIWIGTGANEFGPLSSLDDAFAGLRAHPEWDFELNGIHGSYHAYVLGPDMNGRSAWASEASPCRAIVIACLRAVGVEV